MIIAQLAGGYSLIQLAITAIIICGVVGIVFIVMKQAGINLPQWVWAIIGIVVLCFVAIVAIRFLASL
jgi:hypothetical protein